MKIKKKELRKGLAQLPINYPDPDVLPESLPGGRINMETEIVQVELLCKRLAHNEVVVRDAALAEIPRYLSRLTTGMDEMEESYRDEIARVRAYFAEHPKTPNPYRYDNLPRALQEFREKDQDRERKDRRRMALASLKLHHKQEQSERESRGRFGTSHVSASLSMDAINNVGDAAVTGAGEADMSKSESDYDNDSLNTWHAHRDMYRTWILAWCDLELIFLKLCRGLFFCLWHSDKPLVQLSCAQHIADLLKAPHGFRCKNLFYAAIFRVLSREWPTIDRYRMDKYLALVRKLVFGWVNLIRSLDEIEQADHVQDGILHVPETVKAGPVEATRGIEEFIVPLPKCGKRLRRFESNTQKSINHLALEESSDVITSLTAIAIPQEYIRHYFSNRPTLVQTLMEFFYILQEQIFPTHTSTGLTMHICDVAFDEFSKAFVSPKLFVTLAAAIPLYAMSQGNYVEKRVLDNFFPPLACGVYAKQREEQLFQREREFIKDCCRREARRTHTGKRIREWEKTNEKKCLEEVKKVSDQDAKAVILELAKCCQRYAVAKGTVRSVRVMFSEAELILRQAANADAYENLTLADQHRRLAREIDEMNETRKLVKTEREATRELKREHKKQALIANLRAQRKSDLGPQKLGQGKRAKNVSGVETSPPRKKIVLNTKRKKHYQLTRQDLYGDCDDDSGY